MKRNLPDFLIVGAAKCGTTSLYNYLSKHEQIFLPESKEPKYFTSKILDFPMGGRGDELTEELMIKNYNEYYSLFESKTSEQICGEASVDYLFYAKEIAPMIMEKLGDIKIIIMLRNPAIRAFSAYKHLVRDVRETQTFEDALLLEEQRKKENYEFIWYYKTAGLYYENVKIFNEIFTNVKIIKFDNLVNKPNDTIIDLLEFLNVSKDFIPEASKIYNKTGMPRNEFLQTLLKGSPEQRTRKFLRYIMPKKMRSFVRDKMENLNISEKQLTLSNATYLELMKFYEKDLRMLKNEFNIDLKK